jgi:hypothetical protein
MMVVVPVRVTVADLAAMIMRPPPAVFVVAVIAPAPLAIVVIIVIGASRCERPAQTERKCDQSAQESRFREIHGHLLPKVAFEPRSWLGSAMSNRDAVPSNEAKQSIKLQMEEPNGSA